MNGNTNSGRKGAQYKYKYNSLLIFQWHATLIFIMRFDLLLSSVTCSFQCDSSNWSSLRHWTAWWMWKSAEGFGGSAWCPWRQKIVRPAESSGAWMSEREKRAQHQTLAMQMSFSSPVSTPALEGQWLSFTVGLIRCGVLGKACW